MESVHARDIRPTPMVAQGQRTGWSYRNGPFLERNRNLRFAKNEDSVNRWSRIPKESPFQKGMGQYRRFTRWRWRRLRIDLDFRHGLKL